MELRKHVKIKPIVDAKSDSLIIGAVKTHLNPYIELYLTDGNDVYIDPNDKHGGIIIDLPPVSEERLNELERLDKECTYRHIFKTIKDHMSTLLELSPFKININSYHLKVIDEGVYIPSPPIIVAHINFEQCREYSRCLNLVPSGEGLSSSIIMESNKTLSDSYKY